jgi:hypothetical protein
MCCARKHHIQFPVFTSFSSSAIVARLSFRGNLSDVFHILLSPIHAGIRSTLEGRGGMGYYAFAR